MKFRFSHSGFTLIEMMIVLSIIGVLLSLVLFPYRYYMERAYADNAVNTLTQEWILAHKEVRNGKIFSGTKNANIVLIFRKGAREVEKYFLSGNTIPTDYASDTNLDIRKDGSIDFESTIAIHGFTSSELTTSDDFLGYFIEAPYGSGMFFTGSNLFSSSGVFLTLGYTGASAENGRAKTVLLRPYLQ